MSAVSTRPNSAPKPAGADFWQRVRKGRHSTAQARAMQQAVDIWTRAGGLGPPSPSLEGSSGCSAWHGMPDSRVAALDAAAALARDLGRFGEERLRAYGLEGLTLREMADRFTDGDTRAMATILDSDLNGLVRHFRMQGRGMP